MSNPNRLSSGNPFRKATPKPHVRYTRCPHCKRIIRKSLGMHAACYLAATEQQFEDYLDEVAERGAVIA